MYEYTIYSEVDGVMNNEQEHSSHLTTEQLLDYLEQRLAPEKVRSIEEHLATDCVACGSELSWLQDTLRQMALAEAWVDPPQRMRTAVRQLYRDHQQEEKGSFSLAAWWRSLFETPRPIAIAFAAVVALIIVGALVFQFWFNQLESQEAQIAAIQGTVIRQPSGSTEDQAVTEETPFASGDRIRTSEGSSVVVTYPDDSMTLVGANSEIALLSLSSDSERETQVVIIRQDIGMTHNVVKPFTTTQSKFEIQTPAATINVRGTEFTVDVDSEGVTEVAVSEGSVEVEAQGTSVLLTSGEGTTVLPGSEPTTPVPVPTATKPAGFATPLSSRSKTEVDIPLDSGDDAATPTSDRVSTTATASPVSTKTSTPTPSSDADSTSTATPSKTRESPTPTRTPNPEKEPTNTPTEPPPTEAPTDPPPTDEPEEPPTDEPTKEPPTQEPPTQEPPTQEPPPTEPPTEEPPTPEPPPTEPPPPDPPTPEPPTEEPYPPPSNDPPPPEPPPTEPPPPEPPTPEPPASDPYPAPS